MPCVGSRGGVTTKYTKHTKRKSAGKVFTTECTESTEKNREEGLEEIARRYLLQPVGGFPPEDREGWGQEKVSVNVNKYHGPRR